MTTPGDTTTARQVPVDQGATDDLTMPELLRQLLDRIQVLETQQARIAELSSSMTGLQQAQTTVQQSMNLIQAARNSMHDMLNSGSTSTQPTGTTPFRYPTRVVDNKLMVPPKFSGINDSLSWRVWSKKARRFVSRTQKVLGDAMKKVETRDDPIQNHSDFGIDGDLDLQLGEFLDWVLEGDAWEIFDGVEGESDLEAWRLLSKRCSPRGPACQLRDTRHVMRPARARDLSDCLRASTAWEN